MIHTKKSSLSWLELLKESESIQIAEFYKAMNEKEFNQEKIDFRKFSTDLLYRNIIDMNEYVSINGGQAVYHISFCKLGGFYDMQTKHESRFLTEIYSRSKYGGVEDINFLAERIISYLSSELDNPDSSWSILFNQAKLNCDQVVLMTTGWRNVPSTANVLYDIVVEKINIKIAQMGYPTIINVKLPRIAPPVENYAKLTLEERNKVNLVQDHVIPAENFYQFTRSHVIFADDVLVTGATADKIMYQSLKNGAISFRSIYAVALDPKVALSDPAIEESLNTSYIKECLDENLAKLISDIGYKPILRTLRLLFCEKSRSSFVNFLPKVPLNNWIKIYIAALNNDFLAQPDCQQSLKYLQQYLSINGILEESGQLKNSETTIL